MKFSSMLLYINDRLPMESDWRQLKTIGRKLYWKNHNLHVVEQDFIADRFYWMYYQYDNARLYSDHVVDINDDSVKNNPRPKNQVEMRNQLFACYDMQTGKLYLSDYQKKSVVTSYIEEMLQASVYIKNVFTSIDDFLAVVTRLRSVSFTQSDTFFNRADDSIFRKQASIYGLDMPARSKVKLDYGDTPIGAIKKAMRDWKSKRDSSVFEEVSIIGVDDEGFEKTFDFVTMVSSVEINVIKNDDFRYDAELVKEQLTALLGGTYV